MTEIVINLHMHTRHSDGTGSHQDIADAALEAGLDGVIVTDHNILVQDQEGYYTKGNQQVLLLVGEEIHDQNRVPEKNHLLVFGVDQELAGEAEDPKWLIKKSKNLGDYASWLIRLTLLLPYSTRRITPGKIGIFQDIPV